MNAAALFLDRDGTLVHPRHYPSHPEELLLYDGLGPLLQSLQLVGFRLVVITNQGGLAHGFFNQEALDAMHKHLADELLRLGVRLDGIYHCPHHPDGTIPTLAIVCDCRKPQPGMLLQAARELQLDLQRSWFVGDILDDVEAGNRAGCRTVLVDIGTESLPSGSVRSPEFVARNTRHALELIAYMERSGPPVELDYRPDRWGVSEEAAYG